MNQRGTRLYIEAKARMLEEAAKLHSMTVQRMGTRASFGLEIPKPSRNYIRYCFVQTFDGSAHLLVEVCSSGCRQLGLGCLFPARLPHVATIPKGHLSGDSLICLAEKTQKQTALTEH